MANLVGAGGRLDSWVCCAGVLSSVGEASGGSRDLRLDVWGGSSGAVVGVLEETRFGMKWGRGGFLLAPGHEG
jgi:hypothetical protein